MAPISKWEQASGIGGKNQTNPMSKRIVPDILGIAIAFTIGAGGMHHWVSVEYEQKLEDARARAEGCAYRPPPPLPAEIEARVNELKEELDEIKTEKRALEQILDQTSQELAHLQATVAENSAEDDSNR